jgi:peptide deformylase
MKDIVQRDNPILRHQAKAVPVSEIPSAHIQGIIAEMSAAMARQKDGIAIAAPQIGASVRIFVVSGDLLKQADKTYTGEGGNLVFINPEILKLSRDKKEMEEGCLSVRWLYGKVKRSTRATIRAYNEKGEKVERGASGLLAQIFQHETDHLDGMLFTDKATEVWEMSDEEIRELQGKHHES